MTSELQLHSEMERSRLIQRLDQPQKFDNPFSFGGGLANGGLSDEAMDVLRNIFSFDYMGAAEFEMGAVPNALNLIGKHAIEGQLIAGQHLNVYYVAPSSYEAGVKHAISGLLEDERKMRLKEYCGLAEAIGNQGETLRQTAGWLELDNGFFLFVDEEMFGKTKLLFDIE